MRGISHGRNCNATLAALWAAAHVLGLSGQAAEPARRPVQLVRSAEGIVVSDSPAASRVGRAVLARGGNAVDAAVATAFALAVTWPEAGNIGGGGFMMVFPASGETDGKREPTCIDYRETAPAAASERMFARGESRENCKAAGVPGTVRGLALAHEQHGRLPWAELVQPAIDLAERGFEVDAWLAYSLNGVLNQSAVQSDSRYAELRRVYGHPAGRAWQAGDTLRLPDLAETLTRIAADGADAFYTGAVAELIAAEMERGEGLITRDDLAAYRAVVRQPIRGTYRGYDLYGPPPPSSGGIAVIEALNILEGFELRQQPRLSARNVHLIAEALRRAFCDRARYLGDPDFVEIPGHLTSKSYAAELARQIDLARATPSQSLAPEIPLSDESEQTTHFSVIDAAGMAVSNTYTLEASWGSRIVVRGAGFVLNNEMGDFNWVPGRTDRTGQIGTDANLIRPGKRMLSSQSPFIVAREGRVVLVTGSPGGRTIISTVLGILVDTLEFEMPIEASLNSPRVHHQWWPDELRIESLIDDQQSDLVGELQGLGHQVRVRGRQGSAHSIQLDEELGGYVGAADWRRGGMAAGAGRAP